IVFIRPPDPGTPILHSFQWRGAAAGPHLLTAKATNMLGATVSSPPVRITVGGVANQPPRVAMTRPTADAEFPPNTPIEIIAEGIDPDGFEGKVEFFAHGRKYGD